MGRYFEELKRRNVFRVAAAYAVVGWLIIEVADTLAPRMALPEWVPGLIIMLVLIGFPIALVFSWAFDLTPEGIKKTGELEDDAPVAASTGQKVNYLIICALAVVILFQQIAPSLSTISPFSDEPDSAPAIAIAVLPFSDLSPAGDQEYLGDGVAEEILNVLASVDGLDVTSRTSAFAFKTQALQVPDIGEILDVSYVVEGSVRKQGERVRITAQLIDVSDDRHLWSETYDSDLSDIFRLQDEIAGQISASLSSNLNFTLPGAQREIPAWNLGAYELYLQARQLIVERNERDYPKAIDMLDAAIQLEPAFSDAWAQKAVALTLLAFRQSLDTDTVATSWKTYDQAWSAARRATDIDPEHPLGLAVKGIIRKNQWQWMEARVYLERAVSVDQPDDYAYLWLGIMQSMGGEIDDAVASFDAGLANSPTAPNLHRWRTRLLSHLGRFQEVWDSRETVGVAPMIDTLIYQQMAGLRLGKTTADEFNAFLSENSESSPELIETMARLARSLSDGKPTDVTSIELAALRDAQPASWFEVVDLWPAKSLPLVFEDFSQVLKRPSNNFLEFLWYEDAAEIRKTAGFRQMVQELNLPAYWDLYGWPDVCRPDTGSGFVCE